MKPRKTSRQYAAQNLLLDASRYETYILDFQTSVNTLSIEKVSPGQLYVFVLAQDDKGSHRINWGSVARNAIEMNPKPRSVTVQCFIGMEGGYLQASIPGTWTEEDSP